MRKTLPIVAALLIALSGLAYAQSTHHGTTKTDAKDTAATKAYRLANETMHKAMDIRFTNDPDVDFIRGMIPHHKGAIDMAKVVLQYGKDEKTRKWATDIIREQEREIAEMQAWLKAKGQ